MNSDARIGVWKLKQNCSAQSFEGKAFPRAQQQQPRQTFLTAPHRYVFPRGKGCAQKSLPTTQERFYVNRQESSKTHLTSYIGAWRQRPRSFPPWLGLPLPRPPGVCEQACPGVLFVEATYRHLF